MTRDAALEQRYALARVGEFVERDFEKVGIRRFRGTMNKNEYLTSQIKGSRDQCTWNLITYSCVLYHEGPLQCRCHCMKLFN